MRLHRLLLPIAALALAAAAPHTATAAVDRTPGITAISPAYGPATGGNTVVVNARSIQGGISFGGLPAQLAGPITVGDDFENGIAYFSYPVRVPAGVAGTTVDVKVGETGGVTATSDNYTYDAAATPGIERVVGSASGPTAGGQTVTVLAYGASIGPGAKLYFGDQPGIDTVVSVNGISCIPESTTPCPVADPLVTGWLISAKAPASPAGHVDLSVQTGAVTYRGRSYYSDDYTFVAPLPPVNAPLVTGVSGGPAIAGIGGLIAISGKNLGGLKSVKVGTRSASVLYANQAQIYAFAPALSRGTYAVAVTTKVGTSTAPSGLIYRNLF